MKNKFNYLLKTLFIFISLLFLGCETQEEVVSSSKNYKKYEISFKEFNNDQQARVSFKKLKEKQKTNREAKKGNKQQRILYNKEYDFYIDTDKIVVIEIDDFKSYTFPIHRPEENAKLENLVINSKNNTDFKTYITKYHVTELEKQILSNNGYVDVTDGLEIEALDESKIAQFNDGPCSLVVSNPFSFNNLGQVTESYYAIVPVPCGTEGANCPPGACDGGGDGDTNTNQGNTNSGNTSSGYIPNFNGGNGGVGSFPTGNNPNGSNQPGGGTNSSNVFVSAPTVNIEDSEIKAFINSLTQEQRDFLFPDTDLNNLTESEENPIYSDIKTFFSNNDYNQETKDFAQNCVEQTRLNPDLNIDLEKSFKSPVNIDLSKIQDTTAAAVRLRCLYDKLIQSPTFKNLFLNTFQDNNRLNVELVIDETITANGVCSLIEFPIVDGVKPILNRIKIRKSLLDGGTHTNIQVVKTILHEFIHAYLNVKKYNCDNGSSLPFINNNDLEELIDVFYSDFTCHIDVNGSPQSQHAFMFDFMIPTFQSVLGEIRDLLIPPSHVAYANGIVLVNNTLDIEESWNWNNYFKYLSLQGLHECNSYSENISSNPTENFLDNAYTLNGNVFSKDCN